MHIVRYTDIYVRARFHHGYLFLISPVVVRCSKDGSEGLRSIPKGALLFSFFFFLVGEMLDKVTHNLYRHSLGIKKERKKNEKGR